jgi:hypothetical protein
VTTPDVRVPLSPQADDPEDWTYLQAVVEAERAWGNTADHGFRLIGRDRGWLLLFDEPLHIDRLRDTFQFPEFVELVDIEPRTAVIDTRYPYQEIAIEGGVPLGWVSGSSPSGYVRDTGLMTRLLRRLSSAASALR